MTVRPGFLTRSSELFPPLLTRAQQRQRQRDLATTTTCDICGGILVVFDLIDGEPTRWSHKNIGDFIGNHHEPLPANMNGDN